MPYGDLAAQRVQHFATLADMTRHRCTIEEIEEYEPHIAAGSAVFAGVDYEAILAEAEAAADVVLWDGGNNDLPFYRPDLHIVVADPLRLGSELSYYPGETNLRMADVAIINKIDTADLAAIEQLRGHIRAVNGHAIVIEAASPVAADRPQIIAGRRVLVVEDGPTVTHGEMRFGAGTVIARKFGAAEIVDPRPYAVGSIADTFRKYPTVGPVLPAMGYSDQQVRELEATIAAVPCDIVVVGTPIDLGRLIGIAVPSVRVRYELQEIGKPDLADVLDGFVTARPEMRSGEAAAV
jgi:predicted GTPase